MISIQKKFLFIHVPKTGGNSVQNILRHYSEDTIAIVADHQDGKERFEVRNNKYDINKHSALSDYKRELEPDIYRSLYKFSIIRNPWERMISFYFSPNRKVTGWNKDDFIKLLNRAKPVKEYLSLNINESTSTLSQDIDFIVKFEHLDDDFKKVCDYLKIPFEGLPHRNKSTRKHYSHYYDDELKEMVRTKFLEEIEFGNYKFEKI